MKPLTEDELLKAPEIVQHIYICSLWSIPIGSGLYKEALDKYPEYFPEEIKRREKWLSVKDDYLKEFDKIDLPFSKEGQKKVKELDKKYGL